jgi:CxxC-x17-CxxC domain-containing protein
MKYDHDHENEVIIFAETNFRNQRQKFGIKANDRRRHFYILGKSGTGKTTLIENMILEDIYAGHGVGFVDPHGDSSEKILDYIPSNRINDVVYFNPADVDWPVGFNILETVDETHKHLVASGLMGVFKKIWPDVWSPRMEYILNNAVLALLDYPGSTLLGINRLLSDKEYRKKVISQVKDPIVKAFWINEFAQYQNKFAVEAVAPIQNKVGQFLSASIIRNIVAQVKSTIDIRKIMDEGKIFIMNLSKGRIGEDSSRLLGGMLITKLQLSAMERVDIPEKERLDYYLYVDEFQNFATESFAEILSEARKYRLNLILAHQYIAQLDEKVRDGVFGNVGTHVTFRVGAADAAAFEEEFAPVFLPEDLVNLANYNIYLKLMIDGAASLPFSATTLPPIGSPTGSMDKVIKVSRERYAAKRDTIEEKIERWWGFDEGDTSAVPEAGAERRPYSGGQRDSDAEEMLSTYRMVPARRNFDDGAPRRSFGDDRLPRRDFGARSPAVSRPSFQGRDFKSSSSVIPDAGAERLALRSQTGEVGRPYSGIQENRGFPVTCSRCGKNVTSKWQPDPKKPYYCEECLPIVKEKMRMQTEGPARPVRQPERTASTPSRPIPGPKPFLKKDGSEIAIKEIPKTGASLASLTPRHPKQEKSEIENQKSEKK